MKKKSFKTAHIGEWGSSLRSHSCLLHRLLLLKELYQILLVIRSKVKTAPKMDQRSGCAVHASPLRRCLDLEPLSRLVQFSLQPPASILVSSLRPALRRKRGVQRGSEDQKWPWSRAEAKITLPPRLAGRGRPASLGDANGARLRLAPFGAACQSRPSAGRSSSLALRPGQQQGLPARPSRPLACRTTLDSPHCHLPKMLRIFLDLRFFIVVFLPSFLRSFLTPFFDRF
jgi:hypothetical protein